MILFDGTSVATALEQDLAVEVQKLQKPVSVTSLFFSEDAGSALYTRLKTEAAERVGITYQPVQCSFFESTAVLVDRIRALNADASVTGILIQKPTKKTWEQFCPEENRVGEGRSFSEWWVSFTSALEPTKDVDGLSPDTLRSIAQGTWREQGRVLPATCRAVVSILAKLKIEYPEKEMQSASIVGVSDLLGTPLSQVLSQFGMQVELLRRTDFIEKTQNSQPLMGDIVVSATGVPNLITASHVRPGSVIIDVGEPVQDVDRDSVAGTVFFLTPVPGGVGPLTVICLLMNAVDLLKK